ncbi:MAG: glycosyltransferase family 39 protein [Herpetosiphon sp.]
MLRPQMLDSRPLLVRPRSLDRGLLGLVLLFVLALPLWNGRLYAVDSVEYFSYLPAFLLHQRLDFTPEYSYFDQINPRAGIAGAMLVPEKRDPHTGLPLNVAPIGTAVLWSPWFLLTHLVLKTAEMAGVKVAANGLSYPYIWAVSVASTLYGLGGLILSYFIARRWVGAWTAAVAVAACWLATPVLFYTYISPPWSHAPALFVAALFVWYWLRIRPRPTTRQWIGFGVISGLMVLCREQLGLWLILPALDALITDWQLLRGGEHARLHALLGQQLMYIGIIALLIVPQLLTYRALTGAFRPSSHVSDKLRSAWWSPHFFDTLLDPEHGAFLWSPIWLIGFIGLGWIWPQQKRIAVLMVTGFLLQVYINGSFGTTWHLTASFGFRRLIEATPLFVVGVALMIERLRVPRILAVVLCSALVVWNLLLIGQWSLPPRAIKEGLVWNGMLERQGSTAQLMLTHAEELLLHRCKLVENGGC